MRHVSISILLVLISAALPALSADRTSRAEAKAFFKKGLSLAEQNDYREAAAAFESSIKLFPTKNAMFNLGNAYRMDERYVEAIVAFSKLLDTFGEKLSKKMRQSTETHLAELEDLVSTLRVQVTPASASVEIDGQVKVLSSEGTVQLNPGSREIKVFCEGYESVLRTITLESGSLQTENFTLIPEVEEQAVGPEKAVESPPVETLPPPEDNPPIMTDERHEKNNKLRILAWTGLGLSAASGIATGVFWGFSKVHADEYEKYDDQISQGEVPQGDQTVLSNRSDEKDATRRFGILAIGFGVATAVFSAATVSLFIIDKKKSRHSESVNLILTPTGVAGRF